MGNMALFYIGLILLLFNATPFECTLKTDCKSLYNGVYFMQNCYLIGSKGPWENRMDFCNSLGGDKYVSYLAHPLTSQIISILQKIWSAQYTDFYSIYGWLWLGGRDAFSGSDLTKEFRKFRYYTTKSSFIDVPLTQLYFVLSLELSTDKYEHVDVALTLAWGWTSIYEMKRATSPMNYNKHAACQISSDHFNIM